MREMRDSGIEWLEDIPCHWEIMPNKRVMKKKKEICSQYQGEDILSLTMNGVIVRDLNAGGKMPATFDGYQRLTAGNLLMCLFDIDVTPRCIGLIKNTGLSSPAYSQFVVNEKGYAPYYYYYYLNLDHTKELLHMAKNLRHSLTEDQLGEIGVAVPPYAEQVQIVEALERKLPKVDTLIANVQAQIEKLKAYKQSLITEVVTKGLDPNAPMKDSGIEWVDTIPEHWTISRIKNVTTILRGASPRPIDDYLVEPGAGENWIKIGDTVKGYKYITQTAQQVSHKGADKSRRVHKGDLILTNSMSFGEPYILGIDGCIHDGWLALTLLKEVTEDYMYYFLQSSFCSLQFKHQVAGGIVQNLNSGKVATCIIYCPPEKEQNVMVEYLDEKCAKIDRLISLKEAKIENLEQYKKSLIYEYVTGKKEVH